MTAGRTLRAESVDALGKRRVPVHSKKNPMARSAICFAARV